MTSIPSKQLGFLTKVFQNTATTLEMIIPKEDPARKLYNKLLKPKDLDRLPIKKANKILENLKVELLSLPHESFGGSLSFDYRTCFRSLIIDRCTSKLIVSTSLSPEELQQKAFTSYLEYEQQLRSDFNSLHEIQLDFSYYEGLSNTKALLHDWCRSFDLKQILRNAPIRFSPGETCITANGDTSIVAKLLSPEAWTVSHNAREHAAYLIYHCRGLKLAAQAMIRYRFSHKKDIDGNALTEAQGLALLKKRKNVLYSVYKDMSDTGYRVFRDLLYECFVYSRGARGASVPKNELTNRFINVEPFFNVLIQACIENYFRQVLKRHGNDLDLRVDPYIVSGVSFANKWWVIDGLEQNRNFVSSTQHKHGCLLKDDKLSTLDLKNASDSTQLWVVERLFPDSVVNALKSSRSPYVTLDSTVVSPMKVSSMGNGFTFGLMSLILYAAGVANNIPVSVFGDDIILKTKQVARYCQILGNLGYRLNEKKSFIGHPMRESCGFFYHLDYGYFTSFDLTSCENSQQVIIACNKLFMMAEESVKVGDEALAQALTYAYEEMLKLVSNLQTGPVPEGNFMRKQNLAAYAFDYAARYKHKRHLGCQEIRKDLLTLVNRLASNTYLQSVLHNFDVNDAYVINTLTFKSTTSKAEALNKMLELLLIDGRATGKVRGRGHWVTETIFVLPTGYAFRIKNLLGLSDDQLYDVLYDDRFMRPAHYLTNT